MTDPTAILNEFKTRLTVRPNTRDAELVEILYGLLEQYFVRVPDAHKVFSLMKARGDWVKNDHIAFRSTDIRSLLKVFLPSPPVPQRSMVLNSDKSILMAKSSSASRNPANSSTEIGRVINTVKKDAI